MTLFEAQRWWIPFYFFFWASSFQRDCSPKGPILFASQKALFILSLACSPMERLSSPLLSLTYIPCSPFPSSSIDSSSSLASFFSFYPSYPTLLLEWENPSSLSYSPTTLLLERPRSPMMGSPATIVLQSKNCPLLTKSILTMPFHLFSLGPMPTTSFSDV